MERVVEGGNISTENESSGHSTIDVVQRRTFDWRLYNIVVLGLAFMLIFTAFQTCSNIEQQVLEGVNVSDPSEGNGTQYRHGFSRGAGYTSLSIIYAVFAVSNWLAPSVVAMIGPKWSMMIAGVLYSAFIASFLFPMQWLLYVVSVLVGFGAAILWTGQGNFLTINSDESTINRNSGIFWALLQGSLLTGNLFVYFAFKGDATIDAQARKTCFTVLTSASALGVLVLLLLRTRLPSSGDQILTEVAERSERLGDGPLIALKQSSRLLITKNMILLAVVFAYTGFELTFFSGVYGTIVGHTLDKGYTGLVGLSIGAGEILGGTMFSILFSVKKDTVQRLGRDPVVLFGCVVHLAAFYIIFLFFPSNSPLADKDTETESYFEANLTVALVAAFLLGLGDSCFNTQLIALLGTIYSEMSAPAFALYKFFQALAAASSFYYSTELHLQWQLLILVIFNVCGSWCYFEVEWGSRKPQGYDHL